MKKENLDNYYKNVFKKDKEILSLSLPFVLIYKHMFNQKVALLQNKYDLTHSELDVLASLLFNGKVMTPTSLYESTVFSSGGMTKILKKLTDKQLISRIPSKEDKRSMLVKIEPKGEELVETSIKDMIDLDNEIYSILDDNEKKSMNKILKKLVYSLYKD